MREDNLLCLRRRKFVVTTDSNHNLPVYPNLAGELVLTGINQLWVADITYIRLEVEFVYLAVVLDAYQHSDRGVQYAPGDYTDLLKDNKILISMSRKGNPVLTKVISGLLYGITATDTPTYIATVVLFAAVAFIYSNSHPSARRGNHRSGGSHPA
jgi:transposase InsO family protein